MQTGENPEDDDIPRSFEDDPEEIIPKISNEILPASPIKKKIDLEQQSLKKTQSSKIPGNFMNNLGNSPLKSLEKKKSEGKLDMKKPTNFKKVLEVKFFHNGKEIDKNSTVFENFGGNVDNLRFDVKKIIILEYFWLFFCLILRINFSKTNLLL